MLIDFSLFAKIFVQNPVSSVTELRLLLHSPLLPHAKPERPIQKEKKECSSPISRVLYSENGVPVIYPVRMSPSASQRMSPCALSFYPLARAGRPGNASIHELSAPGVHSTHVTTRLVSSYLTFSPLPDTSGGCFLLHRLSLTTFFPLGSGMPYAARTFLSPTLLQG